MIAPLLPKAESLGTHLIVKVDYVLIDKMNYHYAGWVYKKHGLEYAMTDNFFKRKKMKFANALENGEIPYQLLF
ncbi:MAG: hypothetical protein OEW62_05650 [Candidatus Bathyarchaeota archaeon]|nr:hypothetical protein [Candidatus Bathyarchaeota archaeon]MDH5596195.1 hypothetical protein [Candidatus Bathyarchaeota archaeon]